MFHRHLVFFSLVTLKFYYFLETYCEIKDNQKVYNLELKENDRQLIAEGIIVGDLMKQNHMDDCCYREEEPVKGQEELASEFQTLVV